MALKFDDRLEKHRAPLLSNTKLCESFHRHFNATEGVFCEGSNWQWTIIYSGNSSLRRHNGHHGVSNHQPHDCLLNLLFRRTSKKTTKLRVTGVRGIHWYPVNFPHKWSVTRKMFPFDDIIIAPRDALRSIRSFRTICFWYLYQTIKLLIKKNWIWKFHLRMFKHYVIPELVTDVCEMSCHRKMHHCFVDSQLSTVITFN